MPLLIAARKFGGASGHSEQDSDLRRCSSACPWYTETGKVKGLRGVPLKTHCRMTMHPWMVDCDQFDPCRIETVEVSEEQWQEMLAAVKKKAKKQRKLYPEEHEEIHAVGCEWTRSRSALGSQKADTALLNQQATKASTLPNRTFAGSVGDPELGYPGDSKKGRFNADKSANVVINHYRERE